MGPEFEENGVGWTDGSRTEVSFSERGVLDTASAAK